MEKNKRLKIKIVFFDGTEHIWVSPFDDKKSSLAAFKVTRFLEIENKFYNSDFIFTWEEVVDA